jgi:serine/threonine protein kinase/outer membrane protein assembly factor BamB
MPDAGSLNAPITCPYCVTQNPARAITCVNCGASLGPQTPIAPQRDPLAQGTRLDQGRFEIERVLGLGGFGIAYVARDRHDAVQVAIKECFPDGAATRDETGSVIALSGQESVFNDAIRRFELEAGTLQAIQHPGTTHLVHVWRERGTVFIAMEYVAGETLEHSIQRKPLKSGEARAFMAQLLELLEVVHIQNVIHRDIKPANIMICSTPSNRVKLIDFGSSTAFKIGERTQVTSRLVTPAYAPLEQFGQDVVLGPPTDLYSLGATFYEAVTGVRPPTALERANGVQLQPVLRLKPHASKILAAALEKALELRVDRRYQNAREMLMDILTTREILERVRAGTWIGPVPNKPVATRPTPKPVPRTQTPKNQPAPVQAVRNSPNSTGFKEGFELVLGLAFVVALPILLWVSIWKPPIFHDQFFLLGLPVMLVSILVIGISLTLLGVIKRQWGSYWRMWAFVMLAGLTNGFGLLPRSPVVSAQKQIPATQTPGVTPLRVASTTIFRTLRTLNFKDTSNAQSAILAMHVVPDGSRMFVLMADGTFYIRSLKPGVANASLIFDLTQEKNRSLPGFAPKIAFIADIQTAYLSFPGGALYAIGRDGQITARAALKSQLSDLTAGPMYVLGIAVNPVSMLRRFAWFDPISLRETRSFQSGKAPVFIVKDLRSITAIVDGAVGNIGFSNDFDTKFKLPPDARAESFRTLSFSPLYGSAEADRVVYLSGQPGDSTFLNTAEIDPYDNNPGTRLRTVGSIAVNPTSDLIVSSDGSYVFTRSNDQICAYRIKTQLSLQSVGCQDFKSDFGLFADELGRVYVGDQNGSVSVLYWANASPGVVIAPVVTASPVAPTPPPAKVAAPEPVQDFKLVRAFDYPPGVGDVQISNDDRTLVVRTLNDHALRIVSLANGGLEKILTFPNTDDTSGLGSTSSPWYAISPDSKTVYAVFAGGALYAIDIATGNRRQTKIPAGFKSIRVSDDSSEIDVGLQRQDDSFFELNNRQGVLFLDAKTLREKRFYAIPGDHFLELVSVNQRTVRVLLDGWGAQTGRNSLLEFDALTGREINTYRLDAKDAPANANYLWFSSGDRLVQLSYSGSSIKPYVSIQHDLRGNNRSARRWKSSRVTGACGASLSRDGSKIYVGRLEQGLEVLDARSGKVLATYKRVVRTDTGVQFDKKTSTFVRKFETVSNSLCESAVDSRGRVFIANSDNDGVLMLEPNRP